LHHFKISIIHAHLSKIIYKEKIHNKKLNFTDNIILLKILHNRISSDFNGWASSQEGGHMFLLFSRDEERIFLLCSKILFTGKFWENKISPAIAD